MYIYLIYTSPLGTTHFVRSCFLLLVLPRMLAFHKKKKTFRTAFCRQLFSGVLVQSVWRNLEVLQVFSLGEEISLRHFYTCLNKKSGWKNSINSCFMLMDCFQILQPLPAPAQQSLLSSLARRSGDFGRPCEQQLRKRSWKSRYYL